MRIRVGTDIIDIHRVQSSIEKLGDAFLRRVFTEGEIEYCERKNNNKFESYAARFAAKEAVSKALGCGIGKNASMLSIEVKNSPEGKPFVKLHGTTFEYYKNVIKGMSIDISLSHSEDLAIAFVSILAES